MNKVKEKNILSVCESLWLDHKLKPGFEIKKLIKDLGLAYVEKAFEGDISGLLKITDEKSVICINRDEHPNRKRFSAAHELGHYFLHSAKALNIDKNIITFNRDANSQTGEVIEEVEANFFAASLLMPLGEITKSINFKKSFDFNVDFLAKEFKVSTISMSIRLSKLGYLE